MSAAKLPSQEPPVSATLTPTGDQAGTVILKASWDAGDHREWQVAVTDAEGVVPISLRRRDDAGTSVWVESPRVRLVLPQPDGPYYLHVTGHPPLEVEVAR